MAIFERLFVFPVPITLPRLVGNGPAMTYGVLSRRAGRDGACFPSLQGIARDLGVSQRTARRWVDALKAAKLITSEDVGTRTYYRFLEHPAILNALQPVRDMPAPRVQPAPRTYEAEELAPMSFIEAREFRELIASIPVDVHSGKTVEKPLKSGGNLVQIRGKRR